MLNRSSVIIGASESRIRRLIEERLQPEANQALIDERIWDLFGEEWCVMFTDLSGFSRGVAKFGIVHFLQTIFESERILIPAIEKNDGILLKVEGVSFLFIFRNLHKALRPAIDMDRISAAYNQDRPPEEHVLVCIGLGYGRLLRIGDTDVFGHEVNAASKLGEDMAAAGDIFLTESVWEKAQDNPEFRFEQLEESPPGVARSFRLVLPG